MPAHPNSMPNPETDASATMQMEAAVAEARWRVSRLIACRISYIVVAPLTLGETCGGSTRRVRCSVVVVHRSTCDVQHSMWIICGADFGMRTLQAMQPKDVFAQSSLFEPSRRVGGQPSHGGATLAQAAAANGATPSAGQTLRGRDAAAAAAAALPDGPFSSHRQQAMQHRQPEVRPALPHVCTCSAGQLDAFNVSKNSSAYQVAAPCLQHNLHI